VTEPPALERLLRRDRTITLAGLVILCLLAWGYVLAGAGLGMNAWDMTVASLFPHTAHDLPPANMPAMNMPGMKMPGMNMGDMSVAPGSNAPSSWSVSTAALMVVMWWVMMIAMMSPSAAPTILLYARVHRHSAAQWQLVEGAAPTGAFLAGYLAVWLSFAVVATGVHALLEWTGLVSPRLMGSQSRWLSGSLLVAAGVYELSPLKRMCLAHCRAPSDFLSRHWRPGAIGAFRLGAGHGAFCVGCCWILMALLFVGGVMNPIWIAALAVLVLAEKVAPGGVWIGRGVGLALIAWGAATYFV
jgi:predicted metal-binding membrane protein